MNPSTTIPSVSVVTATRGRPENLAQLVPIVLADESVRHFVVVIDGDDRDSLALLSSLKAHFERLVFAQIPRAGQLRALDDGVALTDADVVLMLDDDVVPMAGLATAHARAHANESGLVLVGAMPVELPARHADIGSLLYARDYLAYLARIEAGEHGVLDQLWLGNVSIRRSDCLSVGLHSSRFTASYHADQDLGFRLAGAGLVGRYDPSLGAVHRHRRTGPAFLRDARRRGAGVAHLHAVHERLGTFDPAVFTQDLPAPVATVVGHVGSSRVAPVVARALLGMAGALESLRCESGWVVLAKLGRRVMFVRGATAGEIAGPPAADAKDTTDPATLGRSGSPSDLDTHRDLGREAPAKLAVG
jgi:GT2 family glycosyltransferase